MPNESIVGEDNSNHTILVRRSGMSARNDGRVHYLVVVEGHQPGHRVSVGEDAALRIGRTEPCELVLPDPGKGRFACIATNFCSADWASELH